MIDKDLAKILVALSDEDIKALCAFLSPDDDSDPIDMESLRERA